MLLCFTQLYANYFHKVPFVLHLDFQRDSHQPLTQVSITLDKLATAVFVATVKLKEKVKVKVKVKEKVKVKVKFTLEQATKAHRGSRGISLLFL